MQDHALPFAQLGILGHDELPELMGVEVGGVDDAVGQRPQARQGLPLLAESGADGVTVRQGCCRRVWLKRRMRTASSASRNTKCTW